jgi:spore coat polysaccharide biosynthesis protein SpsF
VKTVVVVQARTGSTRLPGKILLPLAGQPLLVRMVERVRAGAGDAAEVVVATTTEPADDEVLRLCRQAEIPCFRGHATDLLGRHLAAARTFGAEVVLKIPSDCPLIDPPAIVRVLAAYQAAAGSVDYASNLHPATWPDGNDVEVIPVDVLEQAERGATQSHEREHTTPFIWDQPERYRLLNVRWETGRDLSMSHRFTIDYPEDYEFIRAVYDALYSSRRPFRLGEILELLAERPAIFALNQKYAGVNWYRHHLDALRTIGPQHTREVRG